MTNYTDNHVQEGLELKKRLSPISTKALLFFAVMFGLLKLLGLIFFPLPRLQASDLSPQNILSAVNKEREQRNLLTLNTDSRLGTAAQSKADDMMTRHYFSHTDPEGNYIWPKIVAAGYTPYLQLGENLAIEFYDTDSLVAAWMNSPTHRANILNEGFKDQGMGIAFGDSALGQYHSAVANTFGALLAKKTVAPPATTPPANPTTSPPAVIAPAPEKKPAVTPAPKPKPQPSAPVPEPQQTTSGEPASSSQPTAPLNPTTTPSGEENLVNPRGYAMGGNETPQQPQTPASPIVSFPSTTPAAPAIINSIADETAKNYNVNRYFTLGFGVIFLLFLLADLKKVIDRKLEHLDKKLSNIVLLILTIVVVAIMYWL